MSLSTIARPDPEFVRLNHRRTEVSWHAERSRGVSMIALGGGVLLLLAADSFPDLLERAMGLASAGVMVFGAYHAFLVHRAVRDKAIPVLATMCLCLNAWLTVLAYGPGRAFGPSIQVLMGFGFMVLSFSLGVLGMTLFRRQQAALMKASSDAMRGVGKDEDE